MKCNYGCGQEAKYQLKNGKWCCSISQNSCPIIKKKLSLVKKGKHYSPQTEFKVGHISSLDFRRRVSEALKGRKRNPPTEETKIKISMANKGKKKPKSEITKERMSKAQKGKKKLPHTEEWKKNNSKKMKEYYKNNPEVKEISRIRMKNGLANYMNTIPRNPEKIKKLIEKQRSKFLNGQAAYLNSFIKNPSKPQVKLFDLVRSWYPQSKLNYPVINYSLDIAIPDLKIWFEYDGSYWHKNKEADNKRQKQIESLGWKCIRYENRIPTEEELIKDVRGLF